MKIEEFGINNDKIIVMLHGANFVHTFGRQYSLSNKYHIIVPHLMGFGDNANKIFNTEACIRELVSLIKSLNKKVMLIGFSLGAQLAFKLISEHEELFDSAVIVSPWLIKDNIQILKDAETINLKQLHQMKNKFFCNLIGIMNGLPKKARKEFVNHMQNVKEETIHNIVYNDITLNNTPLFSKIKIPIKAIAGEKEQIDIIESIIQMSKFNPHCEFEIWKKAAHNIPPIFYKKFNKLISEIY